MWAAVTLVCGAAFVIGQFIAFEVENGKTIHCFDPSDKY